MGVSSCCRSQALCNTWALMEGNFALFVREDRKPFSFVYGRWDIWLLDCFWENSIAKMWLKMHPGICKLFSVTCSSWLRNEPARQGFPTGTWWLWENLCRTPPCLCYIYGASKSSVCLGSILCCAGTKCWGQDDQWAFWRGHWQTQTALSHWRGTSQLRRIPRDPSPPAGSQEGQCISIS